MTAPINNAFLYTDFAGLKVLKHQAQENDPQALRTAAQQFESLLTQMMLKSMREASFKDELAGSQQVDFYQDLFDQQLSLQLSAGKGMGLADLLVEQLKRTGLAPKTEVSATSSTANTSGKDLTLKGVVQADAVHESAAPVIDHVKSVQHLRAHVQQAAQHSVTTPQKTQGAVDPNYASKLADVAVSLQSLLSKSATGRHSGEAVS